MYRVQVPQAPDGVPSDSSVALLQSFDSHKSNDDDDELNDDE